MAERGAGRIFPFPLALVAWLQFLEPITTAIHSQGIHPSSEGAYGLDGGGRGSRSGPHQDQLPGAQVRRAALFWPFTPAGFHAKGEGISQPVLLPQSLLAKYPLPNSPLWRSWAFKEAANGRQRPQASFLRLGAGHHKTKSSPKPRETPACAAHQPRVRRKEAQGHHLGRVQRKGNRFLFPWENKLGAGCFLGGSLEAHQIPTLTMQGASSPPPLPSCSFKMEGPQTPSSGAAMATARRQPAKSIS